MSGDKSKLQLIGEIAQANNKNLELIEELNDREDEIEQLRLELSGYRQAILQDKEMLGLKQEIERLKKALLDIKELVVNNACLSEEYNRCVDDLIYYKCDELLDIVNKALVGDKE